MLRNAANLSSSGTWRSSPTAACCFSGEQSQQSKEFALPLVLFFLNEQKNGGRSRRHLKREGASQASLCCPPAVAWLDLHGWVSIGHSPGELHTGNLVQGPALPVEPKSSHRSKLEFRL